MVLTAREKNRQDKLISAAYTASCQGVEIDVMDISKIFACGYRLLAEGADDAGLREGVRAFVETIRKDK